MNGVSVIIATFGENDLYRRLALRAAASVTQQTVEPLEVVRVHGDTLQKARNEGAELAKGEWLIFLDADDELDPRYVEAMLAAEGDIRRPATLGIVDGVEDVAPVMIPKRDLLMSNYIVIGAMHRREDFLAVGGFNNYPCLEDWDLWLRIVYNGAEVVDVPEAVYRVHVIPDSRNSDVSIHAKVYSKIRHQYRSRR